MVVREGLDDVGKKKWAEAVVEILNKAFPFNPR